MSKSGSVIDPWSSFEEKDGIDRFTEQVFAAVSFSVISVVFTVCGIANFTIPISGVALALVLMLPVAPLIAVGTVVGVIAYAPLQLYRLFKLLTQHMPVEGAILVTSIFVLRQLPLIFTLAALGVVVAATRTGLQNRYKKVAEQELQTQDAVYDKTNSRLGGFIKKCPALTTDGFKPSILTTIDNGGMLLSLLSSSLRTFKSTNLWYRTEQISLGDGMSVELKWLDRSDGFNDSENNRLEENNPFNKTIEHPVVIIVDGGRPVDRDHSVLKMSMKNEYVIVSVPVYQVSTSSKSGALVKLLGPADVAKIVSVVQTRFPKTVGIMGMGVGAGANVLSNYLSNEGTKCPLSGSFLWGARWSGSNYNQWFDTFAATHLLDVYKGFVSSNAEVLKGKVDMSAVEGARSIQALDVILKTDTKMGTASAKSISVPTLIVGAKDDPINGDASPTNAGPGVVHCSTETGGFMGGSELFTGYENDEHLHTATFAERAMKEWFSSILNGASDVKAP
mmetsp:Transcript_23877/g.28874  ORF Transcript_23877/g.28874 Transcript_23877/m.28874 type:complete len:506 (+) Transcript_23877:172-1689(+)|eukprot:CAMPEP_0197861272 /NCGR_PEP_ID=MMETSP1438-20131217/37202_1 /TAXON_ID=1461541 /ORGANISM="Pterosperma sp., Strain CCMP1384" /LENGTH=505 /DNA_ID=CAMNT_0043478391 /DNA_START=167 /DNA_END=1684 /DNA_ORIENTATION=+